MDKQATVTWAFSCRRFSFMQTRPLAQTRAGIALTFSFFLALILFAVVALPPSSRATGGTSRVSGITGKRPRPEFVPGEVLVRYQSESVAKLQPRTTTLQSSEGQAIVMQVERFEGLEIVSGLRIARVAPEDTLKAIEAFKQQPNVLYAEPNYLSYPNTTTPNDPNFGQLYGLTKIGAPQAWDIQKGSTSVVVGVIDEGIDISHPDLQANIWTNPAPGSIPGFTGDVHGYDFIDNTGTIPAEDHATHVAGTIGAVGNNGQGVVGVNWNVGLMSLRFLSASGNGGSDSDAIRACNYAKQMRDLWISSGGTKGANLRVLNNSYGGGGFSQAFLDAITALNQSGILFVASAGNDSVNSDTTPQYPSGFNSPNVIAVAATNSSDSLASFSNFGPQTVALGAPGVSILSTTPKNQSICALVSTDANGYTYSRCSGTSMSSPHVAGAAALLLAQNPNLTVQQVKSLLLFNGDVLSALVDKTVTGRRLNVFNSLQALAENDTTAPGSVTNLHVNAQTGRTINLGWAASGDDGATGQASLYQLTFTDSGTGVVIPLKSVIPANAGSAQAVDVNVPYRHHLGTINLREFDNVGNEGSPVSVSVTVSFAEGDPYAPTLGSPATLSSGGTPLAFNCDDCFKENVTLPFSFPFFGQNFSGATVSSNGSLYFSLHPAHDVPSSSTELAGLKMIAGLWDDLDLRTSSRADADVYVVQPDANRIIFRWQGVPCNDNGSGCTGGDPVNFEIELRNDGTVQVRYGSGNTNMFPVVGISGGEPDAYVITSLTSEINSTSLTNAEKVTFLPRAVMNPIDNSDFFVSQQYRDFLSRESDPDGLAFWTNAITSCPAGDQQCIHDRRIAVADAFFFEPEFQVTGGYVYRIYKAALGVNPTFAQFQPDRAQVVGGLNLDQAKTAFALDFVQRPAFVTAYPAGMTGQQFVDRMAAVVLQDTDGVVDLSSQKPSLVALYDGTNNGRATILRQIADNSAFVDGEYNKSFVYTEYVGYLRRDPEPDGYTFWLGQVNRFPLRDIDIQHAMVCSFITSIEYQQRFSSIVTHSNQECPQ